MSSVGSSVVLDLVLVHHVGLDVAPARRRRPRGDPLVGGQRVHEAEVQLQDVDAGL